MTDRHKVLRLECQGKLDDIRCTLRDLDRYLGTCAIPSEWAEDLNLVLAEVMTNIVRHGYPKEPGTIALQLLQTDHALECHIIDQGIAFDPSLLGQIAPDPSELNEGGYGWFIIRNLTRKVSYQHRNGQNILCFTIPIDASSRAPR